MTREKKNFAHNLRKYFKRATIIKSKKERLDGVGRVQYLIGADKLVLTDNVPRLYDQMLIYAWDEKKGEQGIDDPVKWNDHGPDALRYFAMSVGGI